MRTGIQVCGPDELKVLQQIVNSVFAEMRQTGISVDDDDAHLRLRVSKQVFKYASGDVLNVESIKRAVLASFRN